MKILELFSGTHSIGKAAKKRGHKVVSLDKDMGEFCPWYDGYKSNHHIKVDIMDWDYTEFPKGHFDLITASPVCLWWSHIRYSMIGRQLKGYDRPLTKEDIDNDILNYGVPMVDKIFEILDYFSPKHFWIENPQTGRMKEYIDPLIPYYDVDYCKYGFEYKKRTRIWTNIPNFIPKICQKDCDAMVEVKTEDSETSDSLGEAKPPKFQHKFRLGHGRLKVKNSDDFGSSQSQYDRYRIPFKLIESLLVACELNS